MREPPTYKKMVNESSLWSHLGHESLEQCISVRSHSSLCRRLPSREKLEYYVLSVYRSGGIRTATVFRAACILRVDLYYTCNGKCNIRSLSLLNRKKCGDLNAMTLNGGGICRHKSLFPEVPLLPVLWYPLISFLSHSVVLHPYVMLVIDLVVYSIS